ncbi:hypothetical protein FQR65_LT04831 [Abscondita terminalis]|nr:hypothetical protein FQR65_LT04831 [Abscondita terminalis]
MKYPCFSSLASGITTTHYDKPALQETVATIQNIKTDFQNLTQAERHKRLLPYINFYVSQNVQQPQNDDYYNADDRYQLINIGKINTHPVIVNKYQQLGSTSYQQTKTYEASVNAQPIKTKFTPFLETNALPGPFIPMVRPQVQKIQVEYTPLNYRENIPNYSVIYDKLPQVKFHEGSYDPRPSYPATKNRIQFVQRKPHINYIPLREYQEAHKPMKTYVHTYTPTSIDIPTHEENYQHVYESHNQVLPQEQNKQVTLQTTRPGNGKSPILNAEILQLNHIPIITLSPQLHEHKQYHTQNHKQYLQEISPSSKPIILIPQKQYQSILINPTMKSKRPLISVQPTPTYATETITPQFQPTVKPIEATTAATNTIHIDNHQNSLSQILKNLQDTNVLPQAITPDNIDNSIKTLINILNSFKKGQKLLRPIVVEDTEVEINQENNENEDPSSYVSEMFPANTPEGGTPGRPGIDYPALSHIPPTSFDCQTQRYKGFFADPDTSCQVWHYCDLNGGQASFLCPNGTIFSQVALTCDWWFNVKCSTTTQLYVLNERLYKYIIPLKPKFPEDYAGPLVDKYLALKFKEMEEKLSKEKKDKEKDKNEEVDELQLLEDQNQESQSHTTESYKSHN